MDVKVSAIVPVYNTEKFLEKCIRSIMSQTLKEIEIICINDGSTDNSLEILKKLQKEDNRIIIIDKKNEGVSIARNIGIERARGEFLSFIDSDDWIDKNYYEICYKKLKISESDIIVTDFFSENINGENQKYEKDVFSLEKIEKIRYVEDILLINVTGALWNKIIRKEIVQRKNIRFEKELKVGEDIYFLIEILKEANSIIKLNKAFLHYIQHNNNTIKNIKIEYIINFHKVYSKLIKNISFQIDKNKVITGYIIIVSWLFLANKEVFAKENEFYLNDYLNKASECNIKLIKNKKLKIFVKILKHINNLKMFYILWKMNRMYQVLKNIKKNKK